MAYILNPNLFMKKKPNLEDAREIDQISDNQNTRDRNEHQTILEESALANSKLFHPNIKSTEFVNHKFKADSATRNNEHSPVLPAECLSTETRIISEFEMKREFDIVLKELCMFHEIGKEEETSCIAETRSNEEQNDFDKDDSMEIKEDLTVVSEKICAPPLPCDTITSVPNVPKTVQSSFKWKKIHVDGVKEVAHEYCSSSPSDDEFLSPSGKDFEKALSQSPALFSDTFVEERIHSLSKGGSSLSHGIVRVYPLKTCRGPIRIGLSRKAKPKQLHPYLK
ncbi:RAD51-associated protein 2 [Antechinus flavipes]|uniref:RAD51-associated protein 2 n=1 Tax=Antechinus flavipes TaxID=38775 RepID=UPI0022367670|nr:RAD51-associated protein 2 [Antechinus flavipes]